LEVLSANINTPFALDLDTYVEKCSAISGAYPFRLLSRQCFLSPFVNCWDYFEEFSTSVYCTILFFSFFRLSIYVGDRATAVSAQSVSPPSSRRRHQLFPLSIAAGIAGRLAAACVAAAAFDRLKAAVARCSVAKCIAERFSASY
jgi:hypothetical protein